MENQSAMVGLMVLDGGTVTDTSRGGDGGGRSGCSEHQKSNGSVKEESDNLGNDLLEDLDSYLEDINDRLMISRMVSDSVIKGMVNAVEQEASEKIAAKELEMANLKELLQNHQVGIDDIEFSGFQVAYHEPIITSQLGMSHCILDAFLEDDKMGVTLGSLRNVARNEIKKLREGINSLRGCSSIRRVCSGSELAGLGGILREKAFESSVVLDKTVGTLTTVVDDMFDLANASFCEWRQEQKFRGELEDRVIQSCIRSFQEEFEEKMWAQNTIFSDTQSVNWLAKMKEISSLRQELDTVLKSMPSAETGHLHSHGSQDMDHFHLSSSHLSSSNSIWESNGKLDGAKTGMSENWGAAQLKHMSKEELVLYFNSVISTMKRTHESKVQEMTEEYFSLKRDYLRERGSSLPLRKDSKEFDMFKKKIPEVVLKLDDILMENEILAMFSTNAESIRSLKDRLDNLLSENHHLRGSLADKKNELKCLSSQVSDATEKMLKHSLNEAKLLKLIEELKSSLEDAHIGAFVVEEVYKCSLRDVTADIHCDTGDLTVESIKSFVAEGSSKCEIEDSDMESWIMKGLLELVLREAIKGAESQLRKLDTRYLQEYDIRVDLEIKALEKEKELKILVEEKERLKEEVRLLASSLEDEKNNLQEMSATFTKERERFALVSQELHNLIGQVSRQQAVISESSQESDLVKGKLVEALNQIEFDRVDKSKLNQNLELTKKQLKEASDERSMLLIVIQEKQNEILLVQAKEKEQRKQMERVIALVHWLSKALADSERKVAENMDKHNLRLGYLTSQLSCLIPKANIQRKSELLCKQRLQRRCSDLQMAEAEVDLLGDEVDALLSLLEKIYIGLDHYSPVLQHYPGIMEILKLVKRELSGEHTKLEQLST